MESFYKKYKSFDWDNIIRSRLNSYRNAARYGKQERFELYSDSQKYYFLQTQKCIAAQKEIIFFASKRKADNQLKTYLLTPHMLDKNTDTKNLCYKGQKMFTKSMLEHFLASQNTLTWYYQA